MRYLFIILFSVSISSCKYDRVTQRVIEDGYPYVLCGEGNCYVTYVWYRDQIVEAWYDRMSKVTDSLILSRQQQGEKLLNALSKSKSKQ